MIGATRLAYLSKSRIPRIAAFTALTELDFADDGSVTADQYEAGLEAMLPFDGGKRHHARAKVQAWFEDQAFYTPFLDEIAIARAMAFDEDALDHLSGDEYWELVRRLSSMPVEQAWGVSLAEANDASPGRPKSPREIQFAALGRKGVNLRSAVAIYLRKKDAA